MLMLYEFKLNTPRNGFYEITEMVRHAIAGSGAESGVCVVYCPHTTAAVTINEGCDHDVARDMLYGLERAFPDYAEFRHAEGNSSAHLRSSVIGASETLIFENKKLLLGTWQTIYFCEFDAPRSRKYYVKILA